MDIGRYMLCAFVGLTSGIVFLVLSSRQLFRIFLPLITVPLMAQILRRIFGLPSNTPA
ncbi:unnamed protein product, partial [Litomosoides sigmodontis]